LPVKSQALPVMRQVFPVKRQALPVKGQVLPVKRQALPVKRQVLPVKSQALPVKGQVFPVKSQALPVKGQVLPVKSQALPVKGHVFPVKRQVFPLHRQVFRVKRQALTRKPMRLNCPDGTGLQGTCRGICGGSPASRRPHGVFRTKPTARRRKPGLVRVDFGVVRGSIECGRMNVLRTISETRAHRATLGPLALVPTMGALHEGHLSLVKTARQHAPHVAVSIFVNPTQFGPKEDFTRYPRPIERDLELCEKAGVDFVFNPAPEEMYRPGVPEIVVDLPQLSGILEGKHRPGHFKGVCQVVAKLFNIIRPDVACFGRKDFQQLRIIEAMTEALDFPIRIVGCPTVRDADGLAMSSRNRYLSPDERRRALAISRALFLAEGEFKSGVRQANRLATTMQKTLLDPGDLGRIPLTIDYVAAIDATTLKPVDMVTGPTVLAIAARVGQTRLIDNLLLEP
jgi:pantoate--beta-alanine ligase